MGATLLDLAKLTGAVYSTPPTEPAGWRCTSRRLASGGGTWEAMQAAHYTGPGGSVIAFRGTNLSSAAIVGSVQDVVADLLLGTGQNSDYFSAAQEFCRPYAGRADVVVCGHSLGGAIAQIIANRMGFRMATFNAPGVGVIASRNFGQGTLGMTLVRTVGMVGGVVAHPIQAAQDVRHAFRSVQGINIKLQGDAVSAMGVHYGHVQTVRTVVPGGALTQHSIDNVIKALEADPLGRRDIASF